MAIHQDNRPHPCGDSNDPLSSNTSSDLSALLRPAQRAAPALYMALSTCLTLLYADGRSAARDEAIAQAECALRLARGADVPDSRQQMGVDPHAPQPLFSGCSLALAGLVLVLTIVVIAKS